MQLTFVQVQGTIAVVKSGFIVNIC